MKSLPFETVCMDYFYVPMMHNPGMEVTDVNLSEVEQDCLIYAFLSENEQAIQDYFGSEAIYNKEDINRFFNLIYKDVRAVSLVYNRYIEEDAIVFYRSKIRNIYISTAYDKATEVMNRAIKNYID